MDAVKRKYDAPLRRQQAAETKRLITQAAAAEFSEHGFAGTTVAAIATRAGVTPQAVHLAIGPKAALLVRAVETTVAGDPDNLPLADRSAFDDVYAPSASTTRRLTALAAASTDIYRRAARLFLVLQEAALTDPATAELASQAAARRLADHQRLAALLHPEGSPEQIADLADAIWALAGPSLYVDLVHRRSWTDERYRQWLTGQLLQALRHSQKPTPPQGAKSPLSR